MPEYIVKLKPYRKKKYVSINTLQPCVGEAEKYIKQQYKRSKIISIDRCHEFSNFQIK